MYKILIIVCTNIMHGTERYVFDLAKYLPKDKFDVTVATPCKGPFSELLEANEIKEVIFNNGALNKFTLKGCLNLYKIFKALKFDVIVTTSGILPNAIAKLLKVKLTVEVRHGLFYSDKQLKNLDFLKFVKEYVKQFFVNYFIVVSENDKNRMTKYFKISSEKVAVIYSGLNIEEMKKQINASGENKKMGKDSYLVGTVGRFSYQKAYDILIEAINIVSKNLQNVRFQLIGVGEEEDKVRKLIDEKNLWNVIEITSYKKNIFDFISKFDVFILTSRYEGMPYAIFEAMYLGVPVIANRVGGIDNVLKHKEHIYITEVDSPESSAKGIIEMISNNALRNSIIENGKKRVLELSAEKMAIETSDFFIKNLPPK